MSDERGEVKRVAVGEEHAHFCAYVSFEPDGEKRKPFCYRHSCSSCFWMIGGEKEIQAGDTLILYESPAGERSVELVKAADDV
jgi:hypothetical protein